MLTNVSAIVVTAKNLGKLKWAFPSYQLSKGADVRIIYIKKCVYIY